MPNNSPEPKPIAPWIPHSRLTDLAARLSFCRWQLLTFGLYAELDWLAEV
jgi:hypothetical protein